MFAISIDGDGQRIDRHLILQFYLLAFYQQRLVVVHIAVPGNITVGVGITVYVAVRQHQFKQIAAGKVLFRVQMYCQCIRYCLHGYLQLSNFIVPVCLKSSMMCSMLMPSAGRCTFQ